MIPQDIRRTITCQAAGEVIEIGRYPTRDFNLKELINDYCMVPTPSSFYKREVVEKIGFYDAKGNDYEYLIRVGEVFPVHRIEAVLSNFRVHKESQTGSKETLKMWMREDYVVSRHHGAGILAPHSRRYYRFVVMEWLRPVLGFSYPFIKKVLRR